MAITALLTLNTAFSQTDVNKEQFHLSLDSFSAKISRQLKPQIIDARSPEEFALNHINGAINFNLQSESYSAFVQQLSKNKPVFIYSIATGRSGQLTADLHKQGFEEVYDLKGGIANWIGGGKPYYTTVKKGLTLPEYQNILASNKTVLVDIGSKYCGSCKKVKPILDTLRNEQGEALKIIEIELEQSPQLIKELNTVNAFPYLILYEQGKIVWKKTGIGNLKAKIDVALADIKKNNNF